MFSFFKKTAMIDEVGSILASYVQGNLPGLACSEDYTIFGLPEIDPIFFITERKYLRAFAIDFGISLEWGHHNPRRNIILDNFIDHLLNMTKSSELPDNFIEKCAERSLGYTEAAKTPSEIGPHYNVGKLFADQFGHGMDSSLVFKATTFFCSDILAVKSLLNSVKIVF